MEGMEGVDGGKATAGSRIKKTFRALDAFPKVEDEYQTRSVAGAAVTAVVVACLLALCFSEYANYRAVNVKYEYFVDSTADALLPVNIEIDVAMPCQGISMYYFDVSNEMTDLRTQLVFSEGQFSVDDTEVARVQPPSKNEVADERPEAVANIIKAALRTRKRASAATIGDAGSGPASGCTIRGSFTVKKIAGRLQIASGGHEAGHGHSHGGNEDPQANPQHTPAPALNYTHRINRLSFGQDFPGLVSPLDNRIEFTKEATQMYQYFISIVPTLYKDIEGNVILTNQYTLTEHRRIVNHDQGSHGMPGIYMKFDLESLKVNIIEEPTNFSHLLVRLCGIIGGFVACSSLVAQAVVAITGAINKQRRQQ